MIFSCDANVLIIFSYIKKDEESLRLINVYIFFFNSYSIWHHMLTHTKFYSLQERLRLDVSFPSSNNLSFNSEFLLQRELYTLRAAQFFFFNFEIVTILNCFNNVVSIIMRIVDMMLFRVLKILILFVVLISFFNHICKFRQFEHASSTCRIVMTSWSHEHISEITSSTQRSFKNKLKFIFSMRSCVSKALCDLCLSLCNNMCFDVIFDINYRKCFSFVSLLHRDSHLFLTLMRINIVKTTISRRVSSDIDNL